MSLRAPQAEIDKANDFLSTPVEPCPDCDNDGVTGNSPDSPPCGTCQPEARAAWVESYKWPEHVPTGFSADNCTREQAEEFVRESTAILERRKAQRAAEESHRTGRVYSADGLVDEGGPSDEWRYASWINEVPGFYDDDPDEQIRDSDAALAEKWPGWDCGCGFRGPGPHYCTGKPTKGRTEWSSEDDVDKRRAGYEDDEPSVARGKESGTHWFGIPKGRMTWRRRTKADYQVARTCELLYGRAVR